MKALGAGIGFSVIGTTLALIATLASGVMTTGIFSGLVGMFAIAEAIKVAEGGRAGSNIKIMAPS